MFYIFIYYAIYMVNAKNEEIYPKNWGTHDLPYLDDEDCEGSDTCDGFEDIGFIEDFDFDENSTGENCHEREFVPESCEVIYRK